MSQSAIYPNQAGTVPAGGATAANQVLQLTQETATASSVSSIDTKLPSQGQALMAASLPVVLASNQSSIPVAATLQAGSAIIGKVGIDQTTPGTTNGVQINAAIPAGSNIIGNVRVDQTTPGTTNGVAVAQIGATTVATGNGVVSAGVQRVAIASDNTAFSVNATLQAGSAIAGKVGIDQTTPGTTNAISVAQIGATTVATGNGVVSAGVQRVAIASDNTAFSVNATATNAGTFLVQNNAATATATLSSVASSATSVTILASNASRKGAMIFNDSTAILYLKMGATASTSSYTVQIPSMGYYELPASQYLYTGILDGIWSSANGNARVTELS